MQNKSILKIMCVWLSAALFTLSITSADTGSTSTGSTSTSTGNTTTGTTLTNTGSTTTQLTVAQKLEKQKKQALDALEKAYSWYVSTATGLSIDNDPNFKSLACLGVIDSKPLKAALDADKTKLKNQLLGEYVDLKGMIDKYNLGLAVDYANVTAQVETFADIYTTLTQQLFNTYNDQALDRRDTVNSYAKANSGLLADMNTKIAQLDKIATSYQALQDELTQFNAQYLAQQGNIFDILSSQKKVAQDALLTKIALIVTNQIKKAANLVWYGDLLQARQDETIKLYGLDFDDAIDNVAGQRYDMQSYQELQKQIADIQSAYYKDGNINCTSIATTTTDLDAYMKIVLAHINAVRSKLQQGTSALSATGAAANIKSAVATTLSTLYDQGMKNYEDGFRKFAADQYSAWVTKGGQQTDNLTNLQEQKARYDKLAAWSEKESLKQSIITNAQLLYNSAATKTIQSAVATILQAMGVSLEPSTPDTDTTNTPSSTNPFVAVLGKLAQKSGNTAWFKTILSAAIDTLDTKIANATWSAKSVLEQIKDAVLIYIGA